MVRVCLFVHVLKVTKQEFVASTQYLLSRKIIEIVPLCPADRLCFILDRMRRPAKCFLKRSLHDRRPLTGEHAKGQMLIGFKQPDRELNAVESAAYLIIQHREIEDLV